MTHYLPICLNLEGRAVLVVGGGAVAAQKVSDLQACGASITVVSPESGEGLRAEARAGRIELRERPFRRGDTEGAFLVIAATSDPEANAAVYEEASAGGRLVNVCDDPAHCNYIFASRVERGPLTLSIFTHGTSPALARRVRRELEAWLGPEYAELAELLADLRPAVLGAEGLTQPERQRIFEEIVYGEALFLLREGRAAEARALADRALAAGIERSRRKPGAGA